jgi:hypothetical protein
VDRSRDKEWLTMLTDLQKRKLTAQFRLNDLSGSF